VTLKPGLGSLKVIRTDTYRTITHDFPDDFLLTFHSNHGPISHRFRDRRRLQSKIAKFPHPVYFTVPLNGFPLELCTGGGGQKTRVTRLPSGERSLTISSALWIQCTKVTDRTDRQTETDGQTPGDSKNRAYV